MKQLYNRVGSSFQMTGLATAVATIDGVQYTLSVEGLADGSIAIFTNDIQLVGGALEQNEVPRIRNEIKSILNENDQPFEFF